ncbi:DUF397 domain-containing protein, partial [Streptomyces scabiei]
MEKWRKSSYSGDGDGDECVEIATTPTRIAVPIARVGRLPPL